MQTPHSCSNPTCDASPRCANCKKTFVEQVGDICDKCFAFCDECGQHSTHLTSKLGKYKKPFDTDHKNHCTVCREYGWVNKDGYCFEHDPDRQITITGNRLLCDACLMNAPLVCNKCYKEAEVLVDNGICLDCKYVANANYSIRDTTCKGCGNKRPVDEKGYCSYCSVNNELAHSHEPVRMCPNCFAKVDLPARECPSCGSTICVDCGDPFSPYIPEQFQCHECLPICEGCGTRFITNDRTDTLCQECEVKFDKGECTTCGVKVEPGEYHCDKCAAEIAVSDAKHKSIHWCRKCKSEEVEHARGICEDCRSKNIICPSCGTNPITINQVVCKDCIPKT